MSKKYVEYVGRFALFVIYSWFGVLKVLGLSPAGPLVVALLERTLQFIPAPTFMVILGAFEVLLGVLFLTRRFKWITFGLFVLHMFICTGPLLLLQAVTWSNFPVVPTLEGQYIIKNLALIAVALRLTFED